MNKTLTLTPAKAAGESDLDQLLGERRAFSRVADSCSAADAECLRRMREERLYLTRSPSWSQFCPTYLGISRPEADRIIRRFEEFGQSYFDVSRILRISPESFRAIASAVKDKTIEYNGETIELIPENSQRVTAAVNALRQAAARPKVKAAVEPAAPEPAAPLPLYERIHALELRGYAIAAELRQACDEASPCSCDRQTIQRLARDLRQRMFDVEVQAA